MRKQGVIVGFCCLLLVGGASAAGYFYYSKHQDAKTTAITLPSSISTKIFYDVYVPTKPFGGYELDQSSFTLSDGVVVFKATKGDGTIAFTEQGTPKDFDFSAFYSQTLQSSQKLGDVKYKAVSGRLTTGQYAVSVNAGDSWLLVTSKTKIEENVARELVNSLAKAN